MTKVYVIRHAEAEGNLYRRIHGQYDSIITETGLLQIDRLRERFEDVGLDAVYSSDLLRTQSTAKAVSVPRSLQVVKRPELREINMGVWEDMTWGDVAIKWPEMLTSFNADPENWKIPGCERQAAVVERMVKVIREIGARHDGQTVAVVTHGSISRTLFGHLLGIPSSEIISVGMSDNTAVSMLNVTDGRIELEYKNDNSHLPHELSIFSRQKWHKKRNGDDGFNLRYQPMDLVGGKDRYMEYRRDGWMAVHGTMEGFTDRYYDLAIKHQKAHPMAVAEVYLRDKPVGVVELDSDSRAREGIGSIAFYYLTEQNRNLGLGVQLLGQAISIYRPMERNRLRLHVAEENKKAISFYRRYGFETIGQTKGALGMLYVMEKDIALRIR